MLRRVLMSMMVGAVGLSTPPAFASEQFITAYDAKSVGMGLTGTAWQNNASAPYFNAANLGAIKRFDAVLAVGPNVSRLNSPYLRLDAGSTKPSVVQGRSKALLSPLMMAAVAVRPHRVIAVGLAGGVTQVSGVRWNNVPLSLLNPAAVAAPVGGTIGTATSFGLMWDARATVALNLAKWLSIGGGYRIGFTHQQQLFEVGETKLTKVYLNGQRYTGGFAGINIKPHRLVRIGFSYASPFNITAKGTNTANGVATPGFQVPVIAPAQANAGIAVQTANNRLTIAADYKYFFYKDAVTKLDSATRAGTQDAMSGHLGAELYLSPRVPIRAGFLVGRSRTTNSAAFATRFPPGLVFGGSVGTGVRLPGVDLDLGVGYGGSHDKLGVNSGAPIAGTYGIEAWLVQVSANVHI